MSERESLRKERAKLEALKAKKNVWGWFLAASCLFMVWYDSDPLWLWGVVAAGVLSVFKQWAIESTDKILSEEEGVTRK
jgi:hypothetical protein